MDYYIIPASLARRLGLTDFRTGDESHGYIVNTSDLEVVGIDNAKDAGARYVNVWEAKNIIKEITNKQG